MAEVTTMRVRVKRPRHEMQITWATSKQGPLVEKTRHNGYRPDPEVIQTEDPDLVSTLIYAGATAARVRSCSHIMIQ